MDPGPPRPYGVALGFTAIGPKAEPLKCVVARDWRDKLRSGMEKGVTESGSVQ